MITYCYSLQKMFGCFVRLAISCINQQSGSIVDVLRSGERERERVRLQWGEEEVS